MKIMNMRKGSWGKLTAFFDVVTDEGFIIKGFKLVNGINGSFVGFPSQKGKDENDEEKYYDTVWIADEVRETMREKLNKMAVEEYDKDNPNEPVMDETTDSIQNPLESSKDDVSTEETKIKEPFSQDDLPF